MRRNAVDEGIAILKAASKSGLINHIFNDVLASGDGAFPLLISGDARLRDSLIILFVLLVMLGFGDDVIGSAISQIEGVDKSAPDFIKLLKNRFDAELGGQQHFFHSAGVTDQTKNTIRERLLTTATEKKDSCITQSLLD